MDNLVLCFASVLPAVSIICILRIAWGIVVDSFTGGF